MCQTSRVGRIIFTAGSNGYRSLYPWCVFVNRHIDRQSVIKFVNPRFKRIVFVSFVSIFTAFYCVGISAGKERADDSYNQYRGKH